jgi:hypothetical protein
VHAKKRLGARLLETADGFTVATYVNGGVAVKVTDDQFRTSVLERLPAAAPQTLFGVESKDVIYIPAAVSDEWEYVVEEAVKPHLPAVETSGERALPPSD